MNPYTQPILADQVYAARLAAADRGHYQAGDFGCHCGQVFDSFADLDAHILNEATD